MKRWINTLITLALCLALVLSGCGQTASPESSAPLTTNNGTTQSTTTTAETTLSGSTTTTVETTLSGSTSSTMGTMHTTKTTSGTTTTVVGDDDDLGIYEEEWMPSTTPSKKTTSGTTETFAPPTGDPEVYGVDYDYREDDFYKKSRINVTWLNVWNGSTEYWWAELANTTSVNGIKVDVNGEYVCLDSAKTAHRQAIATAAFEAGIDVLAMDLTNGYGGWRSAADGYQRLCYENGKKFAVAVHPTDASNLEKICRFIWVSYAGPGVAKHSPAYLYKDGKPVMILYCTPDEFERSVKATTQFASYFTFQWASGEDSRKDKWGWQIEPQDGPMASSDSMFITPSVDWNSPQCHPEAWRSSLAMLDFCFLAATESQPKFWIIGSMDDIFERNGWMRMDTTNSFTQRWLDSYTNQYYTSGKGLQLRDVTGAISTDAYYNRVKNWNNGTVTSFFAGGTLADGAYTLKNVSSGQGFGVIRPSVAQANDVGAAFYRGRNLTTKMETYYWFYHLGNDEYRIIKLTSGLSLEARDGILVQDWTDTDNNQRWKVTKQVNGSFRITNVATGQLLQESGNNIVLNDGTDAADWTITAVPNRTIG